MASSVADSLHDRVIAALGNLSLTLGETELPVVKGKIPRVGEELESVPCVLVTRSDRPERDDAFDTGGEYGRRWREYLIIVCVVVAGNGDNLTNLPEYSEFRQQIARRFGRPRSVDVDELVMTNVEPGPMIDRNAVALGYDYGSQAIRFSCVESAA